MAQAVWKTERLLLVGIGVATVEDRHRAACRLGELRVVVPRTVALAKERDHRGLFLSISHSEHMFYQLSRILRS